MLEGHTIGAVIPVYNEADTIADDLRSLPDYIDRVYVVDDFSTDRTWERVCTVAAEESTEPPAHPPLASKQPQTEGPARGRTTITPAFTNDAGYAGGRITPIRHGLHWGPGAAARTGYFRAVRDALDIVVTMDTVGRRYAPTLHTLIDPIIAGQADYAKAVRTTATPSHLSGFRGWIGAIPAKLASGYWQITDAYNGYTAISGTALADIDAARIPDDATYPIDILIRLNTNEYRIAEVPVGAETEDPHPSSLRPSPPQRLTTLTTGFLRRVQHRYGRNGIHPVYILYGTGIAAASLGFLGIGLVVTGTVSGQVILSIVGLAVAAGAGAIALDARANAELEVPA